MASFNFQNYGSLKEHYPLSRAILIKLFNSNIYCICIYIYMAYKAVGLRITCPTSINANISPTPSPLLLSTSYYVYKAWLLIEHC